MEKLIKLFFLTLIPLKESLIKGEIFTRQESYAYGGLLNLDKKS